MSSYSSNQVGSKLNESASKNYLLCSVLSSNLDLGLHGLEQFPEVLCQVIRRKAWYNLYVEPTHQYVKFDKHRHKDGRLDDSRNFVEFVTTLPPEGLGTTLAKIELLIKDSPNALSMYYPLVYPARQGERGTKTERNATSGIECGKLKSKRSQQQYRAVYGNIATGRSGAPPLIKDLFKHGLINLDLAAKMGVCDPSPDLSKAIEQAVVEIQKLVEDNTFPTEERERKNLRKAINLCVSQALLVKTKKASLPTNPEQAALVIGDYYKGERRQKLIEFLQQLPD